MVEVIWEADRSFMRINVIRKRVIIVPLVVDHSFRGNLFINTSAIGYFKVRLSNMLRILLFNPLWFFDSNREYFLGGTKLEIKDIRKEKCGKIRKTNDEIVYTFLI